MKILGDYIEIFVGISYLNIIFMAFLKAVNYYI